MDDQEAVERFHEDAIVRGDRRAGLPVVRMFLEAVPAALRGHTGLVPPLAQDPEVVEELRDARRRRVLEFAIRLGGPDGRQELRPWGRAALVEGAPDDLVCEDIEREAMDVQR